MQLLAKGAREEIPTSHDGRVILHRVRWVDYERILEIRGERSSPRIAYLEGNLELMSPSIDHEWIKKTIARLLECWAEETGVDLNGAGSWTLKERKEESGAEPDECYIVAPRGDAKRPHVAIEVIWTRGGLDKLEIYRRLGVREVWLWKKGRIEVHALPGKRYRSVPRSEVLPGVELEELASFLDEPSQTAAVRAYRQRLRARQGC
ncbi:MAG: Uma2 family endonuclease [Candidatus Binatia bacterium]